MASYSYTFTSGDSVTPTKLNSARTVSEIVNADINASAAIAGTKIAPNFGSQNVVTTGAVGAGVTSGTYKLTAAHGATDAGWLHGSGSSSYLGLGGFGGASDGAFRLNYERSTGLITFSGGTRDTPVSRMVIDNAGNVGIGTGSPSSLLQVKNTSAGAATDIRVENPDTGASSSAGLYATQGTVQAAIQSIANAYTSFGNVTNHPMLLATNNVERLRLKTTGQVRFQPLASDPSGAESGDVYYNSATNKLKVYNGSSWVDLH